MNNVVVIELWPRWAECWACGADTPCHWGLPLDDTGQLVPNEYEGEWAGVPACKECYEAHAQGLLTEDTVVDWRHRKTLERKAMTAAFARA